MGGGTEAEVGLDVNEAEGRFCGRPRAAAMLRAAVIHEAFYAAAGCADYDSNAVCLLVGVDEVAARSGHCIHGGKDRGALAALLRSNSESFDRELSVCLLNSK